LIVNGLQLLDLPKCRFQYSIRQQLNNSRRHYTLMKLKLIYVFEAALRAYVATIFLLSTIAPAHIMAQAVVLASNYDGVNYYNGATAIIGQQDTYCFEIGAEFAVAGSGSFDSDPSYNTTI
jgi:hypothetical protein